MMSDPKCFESFSNDFLKRELFLAEQQLQKSEEEERRPIKGGGEGEHFSWNIS